MISEYDTSERRSRIVSVAHSLDRSNGFDCRQNEFFPFSHSDVLRRQKEMTMLRSDSFELFRPSRAALRADALDSKVRFVCVCVCAFVF